MPTLYERMRALAGAVVPRISPFRSQGVPGTAVFGGYVQTKEKSSQWVGRQKYITSSELAVNTSIVAAGVHYFLNLVAHPKWSVAPSNPDNEASVAAAEWVDEMINDTNTPWSQIIRRAALYRFYGFGIQEWVADKRKEDGLIGLRDVEPRPQHTVERWEVSDKGKVLAVYQRSPQTSALTGLPRNKLLYLVDDTLTDSPEGLGIFRHLGEPYERLMSYYRLEMQAYERDLRGIPIGRAPLVAMEQAIRAGQMKKEDKDRMIDDLRALIQIQAKSNNTGVILDSQPYTNMTATGPAVSNVMQWAFELLQGGGSAFTEINNVIDRTQREMARVIGVEHLMMGDQGGNRALAVDKSRNLYLIANSVLSNIASQARMDLIWPMWVLNGFPEHLMPYLRTEDVAFKDVTQVAGTLQQMASAGAVLAPDDPVINEVRELMGVSDASEPDPAAMMGGLLGPDDQLPADPLAGLAVPGQDQVLGTTASTEVA